MFNPPARKDLLDDVPDKFKRRINSNVDEIMRNRIRSSKSCYFNPKVERLFPDAVDRENYYNYLENIAFFLISFFRNSTASRSGRVAITFPLAKIAAFPSPPASPASP